MVKVLQDERRKNEDYYFKGKYDKAADKAAMEEIKKKMPLDYELHHFITARFEASLNQNDLWLQS